MNRLGIVLLVFTLAVAVPVLPACHAPVTVTTPEGRAAYSADQVVLRLNRLQNTAIQAEATVNPDGSRGLPTATTKIIVQFVVSANTVLKTAPDGWQATVTASWAETKKQLPPITNLAVQSAVDAVDLILAAL